MKFRENDYMQQLNDIARDAAKERVKIVENELKTGTKPEDEDTYYRAYVQQLAKRYPYSDSDEFFNRFTTLKNTLSSNIARWLMGGGEGSTNEDYNPDSLAKKAEDEKFLPLLAGIAEPGKDWLSTGGEALRDKAASSEYGYSRAEFPEFLNKLAKYQTQYDRAKLWEDYKKQSGDFNYAIDNLLYPSAMQELQNAVLTGEGSEDAVKKLAYMDKVANVATAGMPSVPVSKVASPLARLANASWLKSPMTEGVVQAVLQGGAEAGRQGLKENLSETGLNFDSTAPAAAFGAGATAPAMIGTVRQLTSMSQGKAARDLGRGLMKSTRYGDPVDIERRSLEDLLHRYNKFTQPQEQGVKLFEDAYNAAKENARYIKEAYPDISLDKIVYGLMGGVIEDEVTENAVSKLSKLPYKDWKHVIALALMPDDYKAMYAYPLDELSELGISPKVDRIAKFIGPKAKNSDGSVNIDNILSAYDNPVGGLTIRNADGKLEAIPLATYKKNLELAKESGLGFPYHKSSNLKKNTRLLSKEQLDVFQQLFPAKAAEEFNKKTASYKTGEILGHILQNAGGRIEPTIKANPLKIPDAILDDKPLKDVDYKSQPWYQKLDKASKKLLDDAFKKKEEE